MDGGAWQATVHRVSEESNTTQQLNGNLKHKTDYGKSHFKIISDPIPPHPLRKLVFINSPSDGQ